MSDNVHYLTRIRPDRLAWMPLWPGDRRKARWPRLGYDAFVMLGGHQWTYGSLPDDPVQLRAIYGDCSERTWRRLWRFIEREFPLCEDGRRRSEHLVQLYDLTQEIERLTAEIEALRHD